MPEEEYQEAFQLIAFAGDSKSDSMRAIAEAKKGNYEEAEELLKSAEEKLNKSHVAQFDLIQKEAGGDKVPVNIILVHAQDHVTMAIMMKDIAAEILDLYRQIGRKDA